MTAHFPASLRDTLLTALAPLIWGSTYWVTSQWLPPDRPFTAALLRVLPAGLLLLGWVQCWPARASWGRLLGVSVLNIGVFQALLFVAAYRLPGGVAAILGATQPLMVLGWVWLLEQRRPRWPVALAALSGSWHSPGYPAGGCRKIQWRRTGRQCRTVCSLRTGSR